MKIDDYHNVYFLGIGGIGMSALARWFMKKGMTVSGYDKTSTVLTEALEAEGMGIHYVDDVKAIPQNVLDQRDRTLVVFTPAIPKDHREHAYLKEQGYTILKRSEVLGLLTNNYPTIAVAGTHGKTTTSSMIAHILKSSLKDMVAFLGGITTNYESNLVMEGSINQNTVVVAEADEFDRSFLRLFPQIAIVTSADADHLDIYGDHDALTTSFKEFIKQIKRNGVLIIHESIADKLSAGVKDITRYTYGMSRGQFFASHITASGGFFEFDLNGFAQVERIKLGVPGFHNVQNAVAAAIAASQVGVPMAAITQALTSFAGVKRRFEFVIRRDDLVFVDDYAHHPTEIEAFLTSLKSMYPGKTITVVFQPHLYTRTRDFAAGFSASLSLADNLLLMDIYPARELPIAGVDSDMLMKDITSPMKIRCSKSDVVEKLKALEVDVVATVGAGDIDTFVSPIKKMLIEKYGV
ncbi:MAG: UDP-N-acetylmuramate--L-alanine ligase [Bacteroidia bacterium]|nr:UDP-N-acetylmuramate--L-alanine ligase [Bacteroidia bacterium]